MTELNFAGSSAERVFYYFQELCRIPHGSGNTKAISDYCMDFACAHDLDAEQDAFNNVIIRRPASVGREKDPGVMLQGHLDMVAVSDSGVDFDFMKDSLRLRVDGDWLMATGTTLGADNGIAVAMCLAILEDTRLSTPALECVFTVDEEIGMLGALAMDLSDIRSRYMLNLDCDVEGSITIGCAGGVCAGITIPVQREAVKGTGMRLQVRGLQGGHSGVEIHKNLVNGIYMTMSVIDELMERTGMKLVSLQGGAADNAIPAECQAELILPEGKNAAEAAAVCQEILAVRKEEVADRDPDMCWELELQGDLQAACWKNAKEVLPVLLKAPNGVQAMSKEVPGLVETSLNLGIARMTEDALKLDISFRSSIAEEKKKLTAKIEAIAKDIGAEIEFAGEYPGWPPLAQSPLQDQACAAWKAVTGEEMKKEAIHAGLECGVFSSAIPGLDIIAYGPTMMDIHSPRERLSIASTEKCYAFTCRILQDIR